ncbi:luciferin sulfotransferase [Anopheles darlingi]|uniref:luciferin sulfotransferase n=1 Tax=Anopheles darlingi TaxID=43151 RepID=UPI0021001A5B|nr:luciferin sulfotransferase [Anopheles darlingi]
MSFPYDINYVEPKVNEQLLNDFHGERSGFVQVGKTRWFFPSRFKQFGASLHSFEARADDTWVVTYPRSGTTWTQEMVWLICNNLDFISANKIPLTQRFPFFEFHLFMHDEVKAEFLEENQHDQEKCKFIEKLSQPVHNELDKMNQPRFIKTHLPTSLLPPSIFKNNSKIIYVARNPSDVVVSYYHLNRLYRTQGYEGDFQKFYDYFEKDLTPWSPYWDHVKEGWAMKDKPNVLFMFYEDMKRNLPETIRRTAAFLNRTLSDEQVTLLCNHLDIKNFRHNKSVTCEELKHLGILKEGEQAFVRKGQVNGNTEELTDTIRHRIKEWSERNLIGTDLRFPDC